MRAAEGVEAAMYRREPLPSINPGLQIIVIFDVFAGIVSDRMQLV